MEKFVYIYLDPRRTHQRFGNEPFYVGKGCRSRHLAHLKSSHNELVNRKIAAIREEELQPIVILVATKLTNFEALELENQLIENIGTIATIEGVKRGPLCNFRIGAPEPDDGKVSEATKLKLRLKMLQRCEDTNFKRFLSISATENWLNNKEFRKTITQKAIDRYRDPEFMEHHKSMMLQRYKDKPELKSQISQKNKEYWSSPEGRQRRSDSAKARWAKKKAASTLENSSDLSFSC